MGKGTNERNEKALLWIGCAVTVVWSVATLVQVILPKHEVPLQVHMVMLTVAGGFFGGAALQSRKNGRDSE